MAPLASHPLVTPLSARPGRNEVPRSAAPGGGSEPTVGIHVYGGNIGTIRRQSYDPATGEVTSFVSGWDIPEAVAPRTS